MSLIYLKSDSGDTPVLSVIDLNLSSVTTITLGASAFTRPDTYTIIKYSRNVVGSSANLNIVMEAGSTLTIQSFTINTTTKEVTVTLI